jgi:hypothetical protein
VSLPLIREQIKAILSGVAGIGIVHDYERWTSEWSKFLDLYKDSSGKINGCTISRKSTGRKKIIMGGDFDKNHTFVIHFIMGLKDSDATGIIFDALLDAAAAAFENSGALNGTCLTCSPGWGEMAGTAGLQIDVVDIRLFGSVLCHYAECRLGVMER